MSSLKKRKLNELAHDARLSAFATRKVLSSQTSTSKSLLLNSHQTKRIALKRSNGSVSPKLEVQVDTALISQNEQVAGTTAVRLSSSWKDENQISSDYSGDESSELPARRLAVVFSTLIPTKGNFIALSDGTILLKLAPGERLVVLGEYEISVKSGQIALMGLVLQASKTRYQVFAPSSHSLPVIRCSATDVIGAQITLHQCESGLESLKSISPLYSRLWNRDLGPSCHDYASMIQNTKRSTFQILFSSADGPQKTYLQPIICPPEWNAMLARCSASSDQKINSIMICGPKSSGKSTFAKLLTNKLLSKRGIALLDLDPGQPEYSPPGQLTLIHIKEPNLGPPFSHPTPGTRNELIRAHSIGAISPSLDPSLYIACALDLFTRYQNLFSTDSQCPLIINTPGWVQGTGLEILVELISRLTPTHVIYMSQDGPEEVVSRLQEACTATHFITLPSQSSEYTTRTAAHLRTMQYMSYSHLSPGAKGSILSWTSQPLISSPPWQIRYSGENPGVLGIICYGEQPPPSLLVDTINGSLVAVVVIEDFAAIPGWASRTSPSGRGSSPTADQQHSVNGETESEKFDEESLYSNENSHPIIVETAEEIPYLNPSTTICLDPKYSHSIGVALIRGIDTQNRRIQALTPISPSVIEEVRNAGQSIVLISGKLDTPGWAYTEGLTQNMENTSRSHANKLEVDGETDSAGDKVDAEQEDLIGMKALQDAPWIEKLEGSQGRGNGSRVWRVRRDLGRAGDWGE